MRFIPIAVGLAFALCGTQAVAENVVKSTQEAKIHTGEGGTALSAGTSTIDGAPTHCLHFPCQIVANATIEMNSGGSPWAICVLIDGQPSKPACTSQSYVVGQSTTGNIISMTSFKQPGDHQVKVQVQLSSPGTLGGWGVIYDAYQ